MLITTENPATSDITALLTEHLADMASHSPPESVHALDLPALQAANIQFFTARAAAATTTPGELLGCAALKTLDDATGELKSMRTVRAHLRKGVAAQLLQHIIQLASSAGMHKLYLETGTPEAFRPARELYQRFGFSPCPPFGDYVEDPYSVCMQLTLSSRSTTE